LAPSGAGDWGEVSCPGPGMAGAGCGPRGGAMVWPGFSPPGRMACCLGCSWLDRGCWLLLLGRGARCRLAWRSGRKVRGDGVKRLDDQVDQTDQQRGQPAPAAVGGQALGELAEFLGEPILGGVRGWGGGVHIALLVYLTRRVNSEFCNLASAPSPGHADAVCCGPPPREARIGAAESARPIGGKQASPPRVAEPGIPLTDSVLRQLCNAWYMSGRLRAADRRTLASDGTPEWTGGPHPDPLRPRARRGSTPTVSLTRHLWDGRPPSCH
jgi:hypothetical protein